MMKNTLNKSAQISMAKYWQWTLISVFILLVTGCGEVDSNDGRVVTNTTLPTDGALKLHCPDAGIAGEPCVLDDPDNPYARTPIFDENKFQLNDDAPSAKARYYLWATAQAMNPRGENQYFVALSLHQMFIESGSVLARTQALRAYRSVLDNYFNSVTFFEANFLPAPDIFFPFPVRKLVGQNMVAPVAPLTLLFDRGAIQALELYGQWGYTYDDQGTLDFSRNF